MAPHPATRTLPRAAAALLLAAGVALAAGRAEAGCGDHLVLVGRAHGPTPGLAPDAPPPGPGTPAAPCRGPNCSAAPTPADAADTTLKLDTGPDEWGGSMPASADSPLGARALSLLLAHGQPIHQPTSIFRPPRAG